MWMTPDGFVHTRLPEKLPECLGERIAQFKRMPTSSRDELRRRVEKVEKLFVAAYSGKGRYLKMEDELANCSIPADLLCEFEWVRPFALEGLLEIGEPRWHLDWLRILLEALQ